MQLRVERCIEIERANVALLTRLGHIMKSSNRYKAKSRVEDYKNRSLNGSFQKWETKKIADENEALARRLQMRKANYSVSQWKKEHRTRTKMLSSMCEYPYQFSGAKTALHLPKIPHFEHHSSHRKKLKWKNLVKNVGSTKESVIREKLRKVLHKGSRELEGKMYNIEISAKLGKLTLSATHSPHTDAIVVEIPADKSTLRANQ